MTTADIHDQRWATRRSFDALADRASTSRMSFEEVAVLQDTHWGLGQDARLREDVRFRSTPWGRWIHANAFLANDALFARLHHEPQERPNLEEVLGELDRIARRRCVFCAGDPRFVLDSGAVRLSARELTNQPLVEGSVSDLEKYVTHLPVHTLRAAGASLPDGQWGRKAQEQVIETLGWVRVSMAGRKLNPRMFVAQIEGKSMDDGRSGLVDGGHTVFELWPAGTKQFLNVLVRGAFSDPDTGSYAVKKYVADQRDEDGHHRRISLVSLNPDKGRYPDIDLDLEGDEDVTVVARVVQPLSPSEFTRKPKPVRRPGRRDVSSSEAVEEIAEHLAEHTRRFFEALSVEGEAEAEIARTLWSAKLVCLETEAGGLHVEAGPLSGLWSFVKQLRVEGTSWEGSVLASNLRQRPTRVQVPPASGPWRWVAAGFEDDPDVDLAALTVAALESDRAHVFRLDAGDVGRLVSTNSLSPGQRYRILLPEEVRRALNHKPATTPVGSGWWLWELDLTSGRLPASQGALRELGLDVSEPKARLDWTLVPPVSWGTTPKGDSYPCFLTTSGPVLAVSDPGVEMDGAASLFLHGPRGTQALPLAPGPRHLIRLEDLVPGRYSALVLHDRTRVPPERLAFEVVAEPPPGPPARWHLMVADEVVDPQPGSVTVRQAHDLGTLDSPGIDDPPVLRVWAPPGWPVRVLWRELSEDVIATTQADRDGVVDVPLLLAASRERRARRPIGDLVLDFAELGAAVLRHERRPTPEAIRARVAELVASRGATAQRLAGAYAELLPIWFEPLCAVLGFDVESAASDGSADPPDHVSVFRLLHTERHRDGIERHPVRLLLLVEDLRQKQSDVLLAWLDDVCVAQSLRDVLVSDGLRWAGYRRASRLVPRVWDLSAVSNDAEEFVSFLRVAAEGV